MSEPTLKLPGSADELLRNFPVAEPDFDAQAQAIEARLKGSPGGVVFDDLLRTPELASEPGEPGLPSSPRAASAPKNHFADMARKSVQKKDDGGAALAKELLAAAAQNRRPNAEMVERVRAAGRAPASATPLPTAEPRRERNSGVVSRARVPEPAPARESGQRRDNRGTIVGIAGVGVALAACLALYINTRDSQSPTSAALAAQQAADATLAGPPRAVLPTPAPSPPSNDGVVSPETLAAAPLAGGTEAPRRAVAKATGGSSPPSVTKASPAPVAKQETVELAEDAEPTPVAPVEGQVDPAPEPPLRPAQGSSGDVPLNPSAGAVSTALGSVRSGAQACLAGQSDPVVAVVTFASDGHVLRVSAGGPSGACIQAALSKAHVAPFAKESFSATTTIRPP